MAGTSEARACNACAAAKRRCGKQIPVCSRCKRLGVQCQYPPVKPSQFVPYPEEDNTICVAPQFSTMSSNFEAGGAHGSMPCLELDPPPIPRVLDDNQLLLNWFSSADSWQICFPPQSQITFSMLDLKHHITTIHRWLIQWIEEGSNPFIHARLYHANFPMCIQDAYTALTCYTHKTASNEQTVFRIIESRSKGLLEEYGITSTESSPQNISLYPATLDTLEHIARVQALLVYQFLCLYDGDIRLRHLAESQMHVMKFWLQEMIDHASQEICLGISLCSRTHGKTAVDNGVRNIPSDAELVWYSWILTESIRRTWVVASGVQAIYNMIRLGRPTPCLGGMMFTTREGVWEAKSAATWKKLCSETNVGLLQTSDSAKLFTEASPEDVNDFAKLVLGVAYGLERVERWNI